ncbi:ROK family protein [Microbacterium sulfonylureivorans]|uniref:ROK family protein n=1 Tax=Microbacterium sulfonylureivorans TaxID=2486854 RepID=UPI000FD9A149|nr:ROK family protein [Microbacterium sulfonylureivorans]
MNSNGSQRVLEIGGTHVTAATVSTGHWFVQREVRLGIDSAGTADALVARFAEAATQLPPGGTRRWGVAIPGPFDYQHGIGQFEGVAKFGALCGVDLGRALASRLDGIADEFVFVNDADAFAMGEWAGRRDESRRAVFLTLGTGIGSSFLHEGVPVTDLPGLPPYGWVHLLQWNGRGIEATVSRRALIDTFHARTGRDLDVREIAALARHGDQDATEVFETAFSALGACIASAVAAFETEVLVIGGSISRSWDVVYPPFRRGLIEAVPTLARLRVEKSQRPDAAPLVGAARAAGVLSPVRSS